MSMVLDILIKVTSAINTISADLWSFPTFNYSYQLKCFCVCCVMADGLESAHDSSNMAIDYILW
jgi:hypothetical protein